MNRFTRREFLAELSRRGFPRTERWHEEWIDRGLIAIGRRESGESTWPIEQVELAETLLGHAERGAHLGSLPNLVVWLWLWHGDYYVPLSQVGRAMLSWREAERR